MGFDIGDIPMVSYLTPLGNVVLDPGRNQRTNVGAKFFGFPHHRGTTVPIVSLPRKPVGRDPKG